MPRQAAYGAAAILLPPRLVRVPVLLPVLGPAVQPSAMPLRAVAARLGLPALLQLMLYHRQAALPARQVLALVLQLPCPMPPAVVSGVQAIQKQQYRAGW